MDNSYRTPTQPRVDRFNFSVVLLELHGMWRVQPAVGKLDDHMVYILVDGEDHLHLYHRTDDYNVVDRGKLLLEDSTPIGTSYLPAGDTGRCKLKLSDWDGDGLVDLIIGTSRSNAIPNRQSGYPRPALDPKSLSNVLLLKRRIERKANIQIPYTSKTPWCNNRTRRRPCL